MSFRVVKIDLSHCRDRDFVMAMQSLTLDSTAGQYRLTPMRCILLSFSSVSPGGLRGCNLILEFREKASTRRRKIPGCKSPSPSETDGFSHMSADSACEGEISECHESPGSYPAEPLQGGGADLPLGLKKKR